MFITKEWSGQTEAHLDAVFFHHCFVYWSVKVYAGSNAKLVAVSFRREIVQVAAASACIVNILYGVKRKAEGIL
jgi:hypothetical protein